jgi:predicted HicB family RNase H-like nuclease
MKAKVVAQKRRKRAGEPKTDNMLVRLQPTEKEAFQDAADIAGIPLSNWVRERLRRAAIRELEAASQPIAFLRHLTSD